MFTKRTHLVALLWLAGLLGSAAEAGAADPTTIADRIAALRQNVLSPNPKVIGAGSANPRPFMFNTVPVGRAGACLPGADCGKPAATAGNYLKVDPERRFPVAPVMINRAPVSQSGDCPKGAVAAGNLIDLPKGVKAHITVGGGGPVRAGCKP